MLTPNYLVSFILDTLQPTTSPCEVNPIGTPILDEQEQALVAIEALVSNFGEFEQWEVRSEGETQPQSKDVAFEHETTNTSLVVVEETSLGERSINETIIQKRLHDFDPGVDPLKTSPWSKLWNGYLVWSCLVWHVYLLLQYLRYGHQPFKEFATRAACILSTDPCPLMTQPSLNHFDMADNMQSTLGGNGGIIDASDNKLGEPEGIDRKDQLGEVLEDQGADYIRTEDAGVLDWIDHALGWKG